MKTVLLCIMLAASLLATAAGAQTYRWTDADGTIHFSDALEKVPTESREAAQPFNLDQGAATTDGDAAPGVEPAPSDGENGAVPQLDELKERMVHDKGIMDIIRALQKDPKLQPLLSDPELIGAVSSGDIETLINNPVIKKLLHDPRVREIEQRIQKGGAQ